MSARRAAPPPGEPVTTADGLAIAVVGLACRFPGARDIVEFWDNLAAGRCAISDFEAAELAAAGVAAAELASPGYVRAQGHLAEADRFEADRFGFTAAEAAALDPQYRLLLETAWAALEDAGYDPRRPPSRTGVYAGGGTSEHMVAAYADPGPAAAALGPMRIRTLTDRDFVAPWVSYRLDLTGPAVTVQTACSTSLTAIHVAAQALALGECDAALAGGVAVDAVHKHGYRFQEGGILSPDGRCRPFDARAAGTVPGNGAGLVLLRRLADARADGDPVRAVIHGSAVTNDGAGKLGFTAPGVEQQAVVVAEAWAAAGLPTSGAQYIEAHGTGTALGDRVEVAALRDAFGAPAGGGTGGDGDADGAGWCGLGSVKSNLGHLDAAAGVAAFIKTVLMLEHRTLAPTVNVDRPHPGLALAGSPFRLVDAAAPWPPPSGGSRLAGVTSLGIGGTNVHVVLGETPFPPAGDGVPHRPPHRFAGPRYGALRLHREAAPAEVSADGAVRPAVTGMLRAALGVADLPPDQSYLAAGGDSLAAVHLVDRLHQELGLDVPVELLLEPIPLPELTDRIVGSGTGGDPLTALLDELDAERERP